jgi:hypothetical protein
MIARLLTGLKGPRVRRGLKLLPVLAALLLLPGGVLAMHLGTASANGFAGGFELGPGALPAGSAGGSSLSVTGGGSQADLTVWVPAGVPTYFLDALEFHFGGPSSATGRLSVELPATPGALPSGAELLVLVGTPGNASSPGGTLAETPALPSGELLGVTGLGGPEGGVGALLTGWDESSRGIVPIAENSSAPFSLPAGAQGTLVLDLALVLPGSSTGAIPSLFQIDVSLALSA